MKYSLWRKMYPEFICNPPVNRAVLQKMQNLDPRLPRNYIEFLASINGGEGWVGRAYLVLWKAEELSNLNKAYSVEKFAPNIFLFGTNGSEDAFAFCYEKERAFIARVPFIGLQSHAAQKLADDFDQFLEILPTLDV